MDKPCQVQEFAALTGLTVRALHYYDRLGLLQPRRTSSGYRLYGRRELQRLEQIVALKFIGIPLKQIKAILDRNAPGLLGALRMQRIVLEDKRQLLDRAIQAIREAEQSFAAGGSPNVEILKKIIEVIEMQSSNDWTQKYYSAEALARIKEQHPEWNPESRDQWRQDWLDLFHDVEAALAENPAGEKAQSLGERWKNMELTFTCRDPEIAQGINRMWSDKSNWTEQMKHRMAQFSNPAVWDFMRRVFASGKRRTH